MAYKNKEVGKLKNAEYRASHKEEAKEYRKAHKEKSNIYDKIYYENIKIKLFTMISENNDHQYIKCSYPTCNITELKYLTLDHVRNNGTEHRRNGGNSYRRILRRIENGKDNLNDFQILCYNHNCAKLR